MKHPEPELADDALSRPKSAGGPMELIREAERSGIRRGMALGVAAGLALALVVWFALHLASALGDFGLAAYATMAGLGSITPGMSYQQVVGILGTQHGAISARALDSYYRHQYVGTPPTQFDRIEKAGGRHLFWLSRSKGSLIFNIVSFDAKGVAVEINSGEDTYFGMD